jgi:hypothetical protein
LVELSPIVVSVAPTSSEDHTQPAEGASTEVCESLEHSIILPSSANLVGHPRRTREKKGKGKVGDDMPSIPVIEGSEVILSPDFMADGAEDEARKSFPKEGTKSEQPGTIVVTHSDEMPKP